MEGLAPDTLLLRRARLTGGGVRGPARLEAGLAGLETRAIGLPRQAVLIVRRLTAAAPLGRPGFTPAVEAALRTSLANAARPARDGVVGQPDAMLFADEAELAAWLIGGRVRNDPPAARWWWPTVLRGRPLAAWWRAEVLPRGDLLPRVIDSLARAGLAIAWLSELDLSEIDMALEAIAEAHALQLIPGRPREARSPARRGRLPKGSSALAALRRTAPEALAASLPEPARRLLAVALVARRDPGWGRGPDLVEALKALALTPCSEVSAIDDPSRTVASPARPTPQRRTPSTSEISPRRPRSRRVVDAPRDHLPEPTEPRGARVVELLNDTGHVDASDAIPDAAPLSPSASPDIAPWIAPPAVESARLAEASLAPRRRTIGFGGLFYLLNALLALELYSDFTQPRGRNLPLSPWNLLAMLGARWFGAAFATDAASQLLADLAGRDLRHRPDAGFAAPDAWITPRDWLEPWPTPTTIDGWAGRRRLMLWHPAGFVIADMLRRPGRSASGQLASLARRVGLPASTIVTPLRRAPTRLGRGAARWRDLLALYLRARIAQAVAADPIDAVDLVCRHQAIVEATEGALDIHLSLDDLPLSLRMAGLDRDPGWIPATGLRLTFHFT